MYAHQKLYPFMSVHQMLYPFRITENSFLKTIDLRVYRIFIKISIFYFNEI
jgi:hypothetical protein